jgi:hypothetical protein
MVSMLLMVLVILDGGAEGYAEDTIMDWVDPFQWIHNDAL